MITAWVILLAATVSFAVLGNAKLSTATSIDGIPSQVVIDQLKASFPAASRGSGQVVFHTSNGLKFSAAQKLSIGQALDQVGKLDSVASTLNPFTIQEKIVQQRKDLRSGFSKIAKAKVDLKSGQKAITWGIAKLASAKTDLEAKSKLLEAGIKQAKAAGAPATMIAPLLQNRALIAAGFKQIAANEVKLVDAQLKVDKGWKSIRTNLPKLEQGTKLLAAAQNFGTVSKNGQTALASIYFDKPLDEVEKSQITAATDLLASAGIAGVQIEFSKDLSQSLNGILGAGEIIGLLIAGIVLLVMLGNFIAAGLPVLAALLGVGISATLTLGLASVIDMTSTTPILGVMLGLAVGIDYSLFIINRHRRQLKAGMELKESIAIATGTSGNAVLFAGLTVVIALVALNLTGIGFLGMMGTMGAVAIAISVLAALTFTPALLGRIGLRVLSKKERTAALSHAPVKTAEQLHEADEPKNSTKPVWASKHPWIAVVFAGAILLTVAIPASSLRLGLPDGGSEPVDSTSYKAYELTTQGFGAGANGQIAAVATIAKAVGKDAKLELQAGIASDLMKLKNVSAVVPAAVSKDGKTYLFQVIPTQGPASVETEQLVKDLRGLGSTIESRYHATLGVTGITASNIDVSQKLNDALPLYLGTVILLSLFLMMLVFRSIAVPLIASGGFLLTVFATLGAVVAVHQWGWLGFLFDIHNPGPILSFLPTMLIGILFGLAMDYQLFLVSGMREAFVHGKSAKDAINHGIHLGRAVVVAAAIIMITVFGGFAFSHLSSVRPIGFGLAVGVLIDAFLVRLILVPATMSILGNAAWWLPKWIDRIMPDVDVEGAKLERNHLK